MTIDEAIKHAEEVAQEQRELFRLCPIPSEMCDPNKDCASLKNGKNRGCLKCGEEHEQLAEWLKELKQLREQEPCEDAISRQAVLNTLDFTDKFLDETRTVESYKTLLEECYKNLPSVTPTHTEIVTEFADRCRECEKQKTRWIPVSEKLPEEDGDYLLWGKIDEDEDEYTFIGSYDSGCEEFGIWQEQFDRTTLGCLGSDFFEYASVIAWMRLPEPYKAESEDKE